MGVHDVGDQIDSEAPHSVRRPFRAAAVLIAAGIVVVLVMAGQFVRSTLLDVDDLYFTCRITAEGVAYRHAANVDVQHATEDQIGSTFTSDSGCAPGDELVD